MKKNTRNLCIYILTVILLVLIGVYLGIYHNKSEDDIEQNVESDEETGVKKQIWELVDEGNCVEVGRIFSEGQVSQSLYQELLSEDADMMGKVLVDAMAIFQENGQYSELVLLRSLGYIDDSLFKSYWELIGCGMLSESSSDQKLPNVDMYLLAEMERICEVNESAFLDYVDLWGKKLISDELYDALCQRLGSDFEIDHKEIQRLIDTGNFEKIGEMMFQGKLDKQLYDSLYEENKEMMDEIVFHVLMSCAENNDALKLTTLRVKGYVSNDSFDRYWKKLGVKEPGNLNVNDVDMRLIYELERMISIDNDAEQLKKELIDSDLLDSDSKEMLNNLL